MNTGNEPGENRTTAHDQRTRIKRRKAEDAPGVRASVAAPGEADHFESPTSDALRKSAELRVARGFVRCRRTIGKEAIAGPKD